MVSPVIGADVDRARGQMKGEVDAVVADKRYSVVKVVMGEDSVGEDQLRSPFIPAR